MAGDDPVGRPAKGPEKLDLSTIPPDDFETLAYLLAHAEDGDVVIVRNKDRGLDARLPNPSGRVTLRGWQAKRFTDGLHIKQCQSSLDVAVAFWRPLWVTFVFAQDLSASEQTTFQNEVVVRHPEVRVDFWSEIEVQRRLRDSEEGRRAAAWLFGSGNTIEDVLAAMVSKAPVRTPTEVAERQAALQEKLDRDPQFFYTTVSRRKDAPLTPPGPETALSVLLDIDGQEVRYDLAERYPGAAEDLGEPMLVFADDERGQEARRTLEAARDASGPIEISSGVGVHWPRIPVGLRGLVPEEPTFGPVTLTPSDDASDLAEPGTFAALAAAGDVRLGMVFGQLDEPASGWDATMGATAGGLQLLYSIRHDDDGVMHHRVDWRHFLGQGQALDQLLSTRLLAAVLDGAEFTLSVSETPRGEDDRLGRHRVRVIRRRAAACARGLPPAGL